jgi:hypothetical protein
MSEKQIETQKRFQQAVIYAKVANSTPEMNERYIAKAKKLKGMTAYNVAVADFYNAPNIDTVDLSAYTGAAGDEIRIIASDDFAVKSVNVHISNVDGTLVEEGEAVSTVENLWIYTAVVDNENPEGYKIVVTASDFPGNVATYEA